MASSVVWGNNGEVYHEKIQKLCFANTLEHDARGAVFDFIFVGVIIYKSQRNRAALRIQKVCVGNSDFFQLFCVLKKVSETGFCKSFCYEISYGMTGRSEK